MYAEHEVKEERGEWLGTLEVNIISPCPFSHPSLPVSKSFSCGQKRHNPESNTWNTGNTVHNPIQVRRIEGQEVWSSVGLATECRSQQQPPNLTVGQHPACRCCWWVPGRHVLWCPWNLLESQGTSSEEKQHENREWELVIFQQELCHQHRAPAREVWTGCCPVTSPGALTYLGRWQLLPVAWNRFLAFLERRAVSTSFSTNKREPCDLTGAFFCKACFWTRSKCLLLNHSQSTIDRKVWNT